MGKAQIIYLDGQAPGWPSSPRIGRSSAAGAGPPARGTATKTRTRLPGGSAGGAGRDPADHRARGTVPARGALGPGADWRTPVERATGRPCCALRRTAAAICSYCTTSSPSFFPFTTSNLSFSHKKGRPETKTTYILIKLIITALNRSS